MQRDANFLFISSSIAHSISISFLRQFLHLLFSFDSILAYILSTKPGIIESTFSLTISSIDFYDFSILWITGFYKLNLTAFLFLAGFYITNESYYSTMFLAVLSYKLKRYWWTSLLIMWFSAMAISDEILE